MNHVVTVAGGQVAGVRIGDVVHYRGIPYAEAPRFGVPVPAPRWAGVRDGSTDGPICPQPPSRLAKIMGAPPVVPEDEACLTLSVATQVVDSERPRPVMVWFHGGAYVVGAGSHDWYRPGALVTEGDVVVVNVNYRLGVFGYLRLDGISPGNLGVLDQMAALRWVAKNIGAFGGDPAQVTAFGESAGGHSVAAFMSTRASRGLLRRAILQSAHLGLGFMSVAAAERAGRAIRAALGSTDPLTASTAELLAAQEATTVKVAGRGGLNLAPLFGPIAGVAPLPEPGQTDIAKAVLSPEIDLLIGSTRDEMRAFFDSSSTVMRLRGLPVVGNAAFAGLTRTVTRRVFADPARALADAQAKGGASVYRYLFEWTPPRGGFGACHTIELPFVFGNEAAWRDSPMLGSAPWESIDALGRRIRRAWTRFARSGDPNGAEDPPWPKHAPGADVGMRFS
ncbi:MAG TPA: carboxylesterase family protein [Polyangiaceae bacterium]|nr:carboxylesterase family protein [Polyangiaceae bacterium]